MSVRKILLPLTGTAAGEAALATALMVARIWNAHVTALHVRLDARDVAPLAGEGLSGAMIEEMMQASETESLDRAKAVRGMFERFVAEREVVVADATPNAGGPTASFASVIGREEELVAHQARVSDFAIVAHPDASADISSMDALHAVLFDSGRPVMVAPREEPAAIGTRICVAWNGSAESADAVGASLRWLRRASAVRILSADEYHRRGPSAQELADYIALHGVNADVVSFSAKDRDIGAALLAAAADFQSDFLVMGAYSHSRLRQLILGGVTRYVLEHATLPVFMSR